jgi:hypothetical protein
MMALGRETIIPMILNIGQASELWLDLNVELWLLKSVYNRLNECLRNTHILFHILLVVNCGFNTENETECFQSN